MCNKGRNVTFRAFATAALAFGAMSACDHLAPAGGSQRVDAEYGKALYDTKCAACHGADAEGGGPASLGLGVVPPGLTLLSKNNDGVFPRDQVMSVIDGYFRKDHYNDPMPVFGEEDLGPIVRVEEGDFSTPVPADLLALANYLESVQVN